MFVQVLKESLMITSFVLVMMLIIEYITVQSKGNWSKVLEKNIYLQILFSALMGVMPGCLGTYAIVSLYTHRILSFAALVTVMIATSGDEIFVLFSMIPEKALMLIGALFFISLVSGIIVNSVFKNKHIGKGSENHLHIHKNESCNVFQPKDFISQLKNISFHRALLMGGLVSFLFLLLSGEISHEHIAAQKATTSQTEAAHNHDHDHDHTEKAPEHSDHANEIHWEHIIFIVVCFVGLFIVSTVPDHFLTKHLWEHVIKKHFLNIFLWTFGALLVIHFMKDLIDIQNWIKDNLLLILIAAIVIGLIPESGPHIVFITLYASGTIPFAILLANSIVQDGHGAIPLLAESRKSFFVMKGINALIGLIVGGVGLLAGI